MALAAPNAPKMRLSAFVPRIKKAPARLGSQGGKGLRHVFGSDWIVDNHAHPCCGRRQSVKAVYRNRGPASVLTDLFLSWPLSRSTIAPTPPRPRLSGLVFRQQHPKVLFAGPSSTAGRCAAAWRTSVVFASRRSCPTGRNVLESPGWVKLVFSPTPATRREPWARASR